MKEKIIRGMSAAIKVLAAASAVTGYVNPELLPAKYVMPALIVLGCVSACKDALISFCDILDDGKRNGSFKLPLLIGLLLMCGWLVSCAGMTKEQWMVIGKGVLLREAPVVYGEIQQARALTSAKEPVGVVNP